MTELDEIVERVTEELAGESDYEVVEAEFWVENTRGRLRRTANTWKVEVKPPNYGSHEAWIGKPDLPLDVALAIARHLVGLCDREASIYHSLLEQRSLIDEFQTAIGR